MRLLTAIILVITLLSSNAYARRVEPNEALQLDAVTLFELSKLTFKFLNRQDFVTDDVFLNDQRKFSVNIEKKSNRQIKEIVIKQIERAGYYVQRRGRVVYISKKSFIEPEKPAQYVYTPKHRSVGYLRDQLLSVFKRFDFTISRQIDEPAVKDAKNKEADENTAFGKLTKHADRLIFNGTKDDYSLFKRLANQIDVKDSQVEIRAFLYEVKKTATESTGLQLAGNLLGKLLGVDVGNEAQNNKLSLKMFDLSAVLRAFEGSSNFRLVSNPYLLIANGKESEFSVGQDVPVLGAVVNNNNGQSTQSIEYKQSGVILKVLPKIYDDSIELTINHQISNFVQTTTGVNNTPTLIKRQMNTTVLTQPRDLLLLGGLNESTNDHSNDGFMLLPKFLRSNNKYSDNTEIVLLLAIQRV